MTHRLDIGEFSVTQITNDNFSTHCYVVYHELTNEMLLIDPGDQPREITRVLNDYLGELRYILLSHVHHEHIGATAKICEEYGVPCVLHKNDIRLLRELEAQALTANRVIESPKNYRAFEGEPEFFFAGQQFFVIHTPGHTAGSVCYKFDDFVFTGDTFNLEVPTQLDHPELWQEAMEKFFTAYDSNPLIFPGRGKTVNYQFAKKWWEKIKQQQLQTAIN
jgi:glyoxylase-like metal-dependent hydrolase (beta-lactamase superfamily II)